ncbi:TraU family protein, partial [Escherichia coli]
MMRRLLSTSLVILGLMSASVQAEDKDKMCDGNFVNPISDICWECIFPMSIGDVSVFDGDAPDT